MILSMSVILANCKGWKSLSIRSTRMISSLFTYLPVSRISAWDTFLSFCISVSSLLVWVFNSWSSVVNSFLVSIRFLPNTKALSFVILFRSSVSRIRVFKSLRRNCMSFAWLGTGAMYKNGKRDLYNLV